MKRTGLLPVGHFHEEADFGKPGCLNRNTDCIGQSARSAAIQSRAFREILRPRPQDDSLNLQTLRMTVLNHSYQHG